MSTVIEGPPGEIQGFPEPPIIAGGSTETPLNLETILISWSRNPLGYVYDLIPKKPKIDFFKYVDNDKKILRYTARFNTKVPEDFDRRFIISFYLADDTISIYEPAQKNSGIIPGAFLKRNRYKNIDND